MYVNAFPGVGPRVSLLSMVFLPKLEWNIMETHNPRRLHSLPIMEYKYYDRFWRDDPPPPPHYRPFSHPPLPNATVGYNRRVSPFITRSPDVENESIIFIGSHCPLLSLAPPPPPPPPRTPPLLGGGELSGRRRRVEVKKNEGKEGEEVKK